CSLVARSDYRVGCRFVAIRSERRVSGREAYNSVSVADLAICDADCLSKQPSLRALAYRVRTESDGWRGRGISLGAPRNRNGSRSGASRCKCRGGPAASQWGIRFSQGGKNLRGRGIGEGLALCRKRGGRQGTIAESHGKDRIKRRRTRQ